MDDNDLEGLGYLDFSGEDTLPNVPIHALEALVEAPGEPCETAPEGWVHSRGAALHFFAFELESLASLASLGLRPRSYPGDFLKRKGEFVAAVLGAGASLELRLAARPHEWAFTHGRVSLTLLARVAGRAAAEARKLASEVLRLQRTTLPEYRMRPLQADEVGALLLPLPVADAAEVRRRVQWVPLDTRRPGGDARARVGFSTSPRAEVGADAAEPAAVLHVFPFSPVQAPLNRLFELLLATPGRACLSFRLEPAALTDDEARHLESLIARCESHAQTGLRGTGDDLAAVRPTLQVQARQLERLLSRSLDGMRRAAALVRVRLVAGGPLPATLVHQVGALLSPPVHAPRRRGGAPGVLVGGYEALASDAGAAANWLAWQDDPLPSVPEAPAEAGRLAFLFPLDEAAAALQLPPAPARASLGVEMRGARELVPPVKLPVDGLLLGRARYQDSVQEFRMSQADRQQHVYVCGQTGTGKSTLLAGMLLADIERGEGACLIDPHGDLYEDVLQRIPPWRAKDVVIVDPLDEERPIGVNPLEVANPAERHFVIDAFVSLMERLLEDQYGARAASEYAGPAFWQQVRMNLSLLTHDPERPATLLDLCAMFQENGYWKRWTPLKGDDPQLRRWVENVLPKMDFTRAGTDNGISWGAYIGSKFESFVFFPPLRRIFGQARSTVDFRQVMDEGRILLVNLAKGEMTDVNARFLGMVLLAKLQAAAMSRSDVPRDKRRAFSIYVDEFGAVATRSFVSLLSEGRKFGISLVLANQFQKQIQDEAIREAIFGNVGTVVAFRTGHEDAVRLAHELYPGPRARDFVHLPNFRAYTRAVAHGRRLPAFVLETVPLPAAIEPTTSARIREMSRGVYGRSSHPLEA